MLVSTACARVPRGVRLPPQFLRAPMSARIARSLVLLVASSPGQSRLAFSHMLPDQKAVTAVAFYAQQGISIRRLLTDNGHCYRSHLFRATCEQLGIRHRFTRPYTPRTNENGAFG